MEYTLATLKKPKSGDWYVYYSYRNPQTGKLHPFKIRGDLNRIKVKKEKEHEGAVMVSEINDMLKEGYNPFEIEEQNPHKGKTLIQVLNDLQAIKKNGLRKRTVEHYQHAIDLMTEYVADISHVKPQHFTPALAQGYSDFLLVTKKYTPKSHNNQLSNANIFFNAMVDRDIILKNPFKKVKRKQVEEGKLLSYSKKQKDTIRYYTEKYNHPMFMFIQWIYYCFIRPAELMQLQVKHIDFDNNTVLIPSGVAKNRKNGIVPINEHFMPFVNTMYKHVDPEYYLFGHGLVPHETKVHRNRASHSHKLLLQENKIPNTHILYDWKNTGARDFILQGGNPYALMALMRHHSLDQTMVYMRSLGVTTGMKTDPNAWKF